VETPLLIPHPTPNYEMLTLISLNTDPCNSSWPSFPTSAFQYPGWHGEQGETRDGLSLSLSLWPPASQILNNNQASVPRYTQSAPTMFAPVPMQDIEYDWINTNPPTFSTATAPPLIPEEQMTDIESITRRRESSLMSGTDTTR